MTGPLKGCRPSSGRCRKANCPHLQEQKWKTNKCGKRSWYCSLTIGPGFPHGRIPGNILKCPQEVQA